MKKITLLAALLVASVCSFAQQYSFVKEMAEVAEKVYPAQNGSFYTISIMPNCPDDIVTMRYYNAQGNIVSTFSSPGYIGDLNSWDAVVTPANNVVVYLKLNDVNHLIYEFDSQGTLIWNNNLQFINPYIKFTKISIAPGGGYYLLGKTPQAHYGDSSKAVLTKISSVGKHVWTKNYKMNSTLSNSVYYNDMMVNGSQLIMVGRYYYTAQMQGQPPFRPIITLMDTTGTVQQSYYYMIDSMAFTGFDKYEFMQIEKTPNGDFYLRTHNFGNEHILVKMNAAFNIKWIRERLAGKASAMCAGYNEDVYIVPDGSFNNSILHMDSTGAPDGGHAPSYVPGSSIKYGHVVTMKQHDCGFLVSGSSNMLAHTNKDMAYCNDTVLAPSYFGNYYPITNFYRGSVSIATGPFNSPNEYLSTATYTSSTGSVIALCSQAYNCSGGTNPTEVKNVSATTIDVYPNPATGMLKIAVPDAGTSYEAVIYDLSGKQVLHNTLQNNKEYTISLPSLATGLYTIRVVGGGSVFVKKIQILE